MGALPKRKISTHRKGKRRKNKKATQVALVKCRSCNELTRPHHACQNCGFYKD